jgi:hypothetical protein
MGEPGTSGGMTSGGTAEIQAEALDVLSDAFSWSLAEERWQQIYRVLTTMAAALEHGDAAALTEATAHLELAGPPRLIPIGTDTAPPPPVRDLLNKLVHALGGVPAGGRPPEHGDDGAPDADSSRG